jgi:NAD dependent epimerase/dehydratase family enzyme
VALGSEFASELLASQGVLPTRLDAIGFQFKHPDLERALASLF